MDYSGTGRKAYPATVTMEYTDGETDGKRRFSVTGEIWNTRRTDIVMGGQCLDEMARYVKTPLFREIRRLWKLYHLNDMHAACIHQAADGWEKDASESVQRYKFVLTADAITAQRNAKRRVLSAAGNGETVKASPEEITVMGLAYSIESAADTLPEEIAGYYKLDSVKSERRGWLRFEEDQRGILGKPCPVCGYKYGHGWNYFPVPAEDEEIILHILEKGDLPK